MECQPSLRSYYGVQHKNQDSHKGSAHKTTSKTVLADLCDKHFGFFSLKKSLSERGSTGRTMILFRPGATLPPLRFLCKTAENKFQLKALSVCKS